MNTKNIDMMVIYQVQHNVQRHQNGSRSLKVELTSKLVDLPSGRILETVSVDGIEQNNLPRGCKTACRKRHAFNVIDQIAPAFAEDTVTQMMQTNWRRDVKSIQKKKQIKWEESHDQPAEVYGYSVILKDFRPAEIKRIMRVFHRHADRVDVWTVRETRDSRTLWLEAEARPQKIRKALRKLLKATGLNAQIRRTERGFTLVRDSRSAATSSVKIIRKNG